MYIVMELQKTQSDTISNLVWAYQSKNEAESKYHSVLASAAISNVPLHAATLLSEQGYSIMNQCYIHDENGELT